MKVGEKDLPLAHQLVFRLDWLLDLHDHLGLSPDLLCLAGYVCARLDIVGIQESRTNTSVFLNEDPVAALS